MSNADDHRWDLSESDKGYLPECDDAFEQKMEEWQARDFLLAERDSDDCRSGSVLAALQVRPNRTAQSTVFPMTAQRE